MGGHFKGGEGSTWTPPPLTSFMMRRVWIWGMSSKCLVAIFVDIDSSLKMLPSASTSAALMMPPHRFVPANTLAWFKEFHNKHNKGQIRICLVT